LLSIAVLLLLIWPRNRRPGSAGCPALLQTLQTTSA
jgi:hypothetical protein